MMRLRLLQVVALVSALLFALASCTPGEVEETVEPEPDPDVPEEPAEDPVEEPAEDDAPAEPGQLTIVQPGEPRGVNPLLHNAFTEHNIEDAITESLVKPTDTLQPTQDGLVTDWSRVDDLTWEFTVREGIEFTNGEAFDAEAAAENVRLASADEAINSGFFALIEDVTAIDDTTFHVTTSEPTGTLPALMVLVRVVAPEYYHEVGPEEFGQAPVGTGPFTFESWTPGEQMVLQRNENYWDGAAQVDTVVFRWADEPSTRAAMVQTGEADIAAGLTRDQAGALEGDPDADVHVTPVLRLSWIMVHVYTPPLDDVRVRRAIGMAIDREGLVEAIHRGDATASHQLFPLDWPATENVDYELQFDPDAAQQLLEEAGAAGATVELNYTTGRYPFDTEQGEAVAAMLEQAGLTVTQSPMDASTAFDLAPGGQMTGLFMYGNAPLYGHPDAVASQYFTLEGLFPHEDGSWCNQPDDEGAELGAQVREASALEEGQAEGAYAEVAHAILNERVCVIPILFYSDIHGVSSRVVDYQPRQDQSYDYLSLQVSD